MSSYLTDASPVPNNPVGGFHTKIVASASGATEIVASIAGARIVGCAYNYMANGTVNVKWQSVGASGTTDITGLAYLAVNTGKVVNFCPVGWFKTGVGEALNINLSGNVAVGGELVYFVV